MIIAQSETTAAAAMSQLNTWKWNEIMVSPADVDMAAGGWAIEKKLKQIKIINKFLDNKLTVQFIIFRFILFNDCFCFLVYPPHQPLSSFRISLLNRAAAVAVYTV